MAALAVAGLRVEDRLAGASNWSPWKARIVMILDEGELWEIVENPVVPPTDVVLFAEFQRQNKRAKRTILDVVKDYVIPHISGKDYAYQMWQSLCSLYQSPNQNRKMVLQEKLRGTKMGNVEIMYLGRCSPCVFALPNTCGNYYILCALYFVSNFTLT
jgi:hypothetical protein